MGTLTTLVPVSVASVRGGLLQSVSDHMLRKLRRERDLLDTRYISE